MGYLIGLAPAFGLGFVLHFEYAVLEINIGPFVIMLGDVNAITHGEDE
jgi:hypothetical protein